MTREDYNRTLRMMEKCRELAMEAETRAEARQLDREYRQMWKSIKPYATGKKALAGEPGTLI